MGAEFGEEELGRQDLNGEEREENREVCVLFGQVFLSSHFQHESDRKLYFPLRRICVLQGETAELVNDMQMMFSLPNHLLGLVPAGIE